MKNISEYDVHPSQRERWGVDAQLFSELDIDYDDCETTADRIFKHLNRPLPEGIKPGDKIDCSEILPKPITIEEIAERANKSVEDIKARFASREAEEYISQGKNKAGEYVYFWSRVSEYATTELLTINRAAELHDIDRRTMKRYVMRELEKNHIFDPIIDKQGGREYELYWPDDLQHCVEIGKKG